MPAQQQRRSSELGASVVMTTSTRGGTTQQPPAAGSMGFASPDGAEAAVMRHFPKPPGAGGGTSLTATSRPTTSGAGIKGIPAAAVVAPAEPKSHKPPLPPVPRLQLTAAEERFRGARINSGRPGTTPASTSLGATTSGGLGATKRGGDLLAPLGGSSARAKTPAHPLFPTSLDPDRRVAVPDYRDNTRWFNDVQASKHVVVGPQLRPNAATSLHSPRLAQNTNNKKGAIEHIAESLGGVIPLNLSAIVHTFLAQLPRLQSMAFTCAAFTDALASLDVDDVIFAQDLFQKLDVHKTGRIPLTTIIAVFDICCNSPMCKSKVRGHCFDLFKQNGFIHLANLDSVKSIAGKDNRFRLSGATPDMVRVLGDVFKQARRDEEDVYINEVLLKKKKGKKKKAPPLKAFQKSHIPVTMARVSHIDANDFSRFFDTNKEVAAAFFPRWIKFMATDSALSHACVMRALSLAEDAEEEIAAAKTGAEADTTSL